MTDSTGRAPKMDNQAFAKPSGSEASANRSNPVQRHYARTRRTAGTRVFFGAGPSPGFPLRDQRCNLVLLDSHPLAG